jgi:gamma-glutamyl-gamma-aminobutyrate hydrolase PuuD
MKKKLIIAIYADSFNGKVGQTLPYMSFVRNFGIPRLVTPDEDAESVVEECDALFIPGGADVDSRRYNEPPHPYNSRCNVHYESMDETIAAEFIAQGKPIVGICRGMQSLNVMFGGSLFQHIVGHKQGSDRNVANSWLVDSENNMHFINTIHHQAVKELGEGLIPIGWSPAYAGCPSTLEEEYLTDKKYTITGKNKVQRIQEHASFIEAFKHEELPIIAFQYHPEEFNCSFAIDEINNMLEEAILEESTHVYE